MSLSMSEHAWILFNDFEYAWKYLNNCSDYARVLKMPPYSYNNTIIVVTSVIAAHKGGRYCWVCE